MLSDGLGLGAYSKRLERPPRKQTREPQDRSNAPWEECWLAALKETAEEWWDPVTCACGTTWEVSEDDSEMLLVVRFDNAYWVTECHCYWPLRHGAWLVCFKELISRYFQLQARSDLDRAGKSIRIESKSLHKDETRFLFRDDLPKIVREALDQLKDGIQEEVRGSLPNYLDVINAALANSFPSVEHYKATVTAAIEEKADELVERSSEAAVKLMAERRKRKFSIEE